MYSVEKNKSSQVTQFKVQLLKVQLLKVQDNIHQANYHSGFRASDVWVN